MGGAPQDPMLGNEQMPTDEETPMEDPMMGNEGGEPENQDFGGNFDAGVEADENTDPEKFIQQLTGKLSQSLKKYNDENPDDESGLNKYVAGMVATQAAKGLTDPEKEEIIKKINAGEDEEPTDDMSDEEIGNDEGMEMPDGMPKNESRKYKFSKKQIMENITTMQEPRDDKKVRKDTNKSPKVKNSVRNKPFNAPKFK